MRGNKTNDEWAIGVVVSFGDNWRWWLTVKVKVALAVVNVGLVVVTFRSCGG